MIESASCADPAPGIIQFVPYITTPNLGGRARPEL